MAEGVLTGIRVIDLASGIAGPVAALLLAEAGADVIKIEPPSGDRDRQEPGFSVWNRSKRSVVLDLTQEDARSTLNLLLATADVLIHDKSPAAARAIGLDGTELGRQFPDLIIACVNGYPARHTGAEMANDDAIVLAEAGIMDEQQGATRDGPIYLRFRLGSWGAAYLAANGILARLVHRGRGGLGGLVATSLLQGALAPMAMHWYRAERPTESLRLGMPKTTAASIFECSDGVWIHIMSNPDNAPLMKAALEGMPAEEREAANRAAGPGHRLFPSWGANAKIFKTKPSRVWLEDLWASDVPVQPALPMGDIYFDEQARANDYVVEIEDPALGRTLQPGTPYFVTPSAKIQGPAPRLGAHTAEVLSKLKPRDGRRIVRERRARTPLEGVRVLDFGNFLAGPLAAMMLSDLGAEVIKVEATTGDQMRWVEWSFAGCQRGKRSLALQLKDPAARQVLERLVRWTDIVHHNLRMPAAMKLGLGYDALKAINPKLIYSHVSSYGPKGPRKDWPGYDQLFQASCGWEYEGAGAGNRPMWHRFGMMDHQCAMASLTATLLALYHRDRTGEGQFVAASLLGASLFTVSETVVGPGGKLTPYPRLDKNQTGVSPTRRIYQCKDGWIVVASDENDPLPRLQKGVEAKSVSELEQKFAGLGQADAVKRLRESGLTAAVVREKQREAFFSARDNAEAGLIARYAHPVYGAFEQVGAFWDFGDLGVTLDRAPPTLGQHSREILREFGFSGAEIDGFIQAGLVVSN